ncbi:D-glycero-beta-D-manno-heptose-7-phosphate kinase [Entomobacter blattae]|uniref:D-glycero-beta-D-manno-heptose-7-phosphate kinase n=1 Tax=Entomobacter blattae TaxID=2762277 RepID=UPI00193AF19B|nr:D-glycero-beta-D-manno-heptose-7-phosphate kinase [Entomobacter blattae]
MDFSAITVLCLGDIMLDCYKYGTMERISPEAPVPVLHLSHAKEMPGGAGNVVSNITSLGGKALLIGLVGYDTAAERLKSLLGDQIGSQVFFIPTSQRSTICKTRFIASHQQVVRTDEESRAAATEEEIVQLKKMVKTHIGSANAVIISDYGKGVCTPEVIAYTIEQAKAFHIPVFVDPKTPDFSRYKGAYCVTPNVKELLAAQPLYEESEEALAEAAYTIIDTAHIHSVLVTRSEKGMMLVENTKAVHAVPTRAREVFDVSGAGDTVIAALVLAHSSGFNLVQAMHIANAAAGVVVGKLGTASASIAEVTAELSAQDKNSSANRPIMAPILSLLDLKQQVHQWREQGLSIGFTNGCFDLLHPGHIQLLMQARQQCERLIVALNTDESVQRLKGAQRPISPLSARSAVMAAIRYVDAVTVFSEDTPYNLIEAILPDVLIKGGDYTLKTVIGADIVSAAGGQVVIIPFKDGYSTTSLVKKINPTHS